MFQSNVVPLYLPQVVGPVVCLWPFKLFFRIFSKSTMHVLLIQVWLKWLNFVLRLLMYRNDHEFVVFWWQTEFWLVDRFWIWKRHFYRRSNWTRNQLFLFRSMITIRSKQGALIGHFWRGSNLKRNFIILIRGEMHQVNLQHFKQPIRFQQQSVRQCPWK